MCSEIRTESAVSSSGAGIERADIHDDVVRIEDVADSRLDDFRVWPPRKQRQRLNDAVCPPNDWVFADGEEAVLRLLESRFHVDKVLIQPAMLPAARQLVMQRHVGGSTPASAAHLGTGPALVLVADVDLLEKVTGVVVAAREHLAFATGLRPLKTSDACDVEAALAEVGSALKDVDEPLRLLALDRLTDAANVGGLLRLAASFGVTAVLCSSDCCDPLHPKAIRSSLGQAFHMPVVRGDLSEMLNYLRTREVLTAAAVVQEGAHFLDELKVLPRRWALVLGSEHFGVSTAARDACEMLLKVRMAPGVDSLNVAVSAGVLLHGCVEREASGSVVNASCCSLKDDSPCIDC